uniref:Uncharacterized protein n=1 Tax=Timema poppense TaxID=170557 RepID=A0A7R9CZY8_TIMPO|nr:unnamed protein product [Timema poppensis]
MVVRIPVGCAEQFSPPSPPSAPPPPKQTRAQHPVPSRYFNFVKRLGRLYLEDVYQHVDGRGVKSHFEKKFGTPDRDSNLDLSVIGSPVYCNGSVLDHADTETRSGSEL